MSGLVRNPEDRFSHDAAQINDKCMLIQSHQEHILFWSFFVSNLFCSDVAISDSVNNVDTELKLSQCQLLMVSKILSEIRVIPGKL